MHKDEHWYFFAFSLFIIYSSGIFSFFIVIIMFSFYQSPIWRHIQEEVYKKPIFDVTLWNTTYWWIMKQMAILWQTKRRSMIHGVRPISLDKVDSDFQRDLLAWKRDHWKHDLFLQIWCDLPIVSRQTKQDKIPDRLDQSLAFVQRDLLTWYDLRPTTREHMPHATIVLETVWTIDEWKSACSDSGKRMINKWQKAWLTFVIATHEKEWIAYRKVWYATAYDKWFSIIPQEQFLALMHYLTESNQWWLFVAKKWADIVSGSVCVQFGEQMIYLYGATDRAYWDIGAHYWLTMHIRARARDHHFLTFDLLGISPPGSDEKHHLYWVTRFKQSFWWKTIVYAWSYDLVCSQRWYQAFKAWRKVRG